MSITDELRDWAGQHKGWHLFDMQLKAIADRIDAEHESEISRAAQLLADAEKDRDFNYANWQDCKQKVLQHNITIDELDAEIERLKDELAHCIALPVDADGVPIHIGDVMDGTCPSGKHVNGTVSAIGDGVFWLSNVQFSLKPNYMHHHHAPTVEDVLREFADKVCSGDHIVKDGRYRGIEDIDLFAEYAAKLQLREDA